MLAWIIRSMAWLALLAIVVVSLVPGDVRPQVMGDKHFEHLTAYLIAGMLFATGYAQFRVAVLFGALLTLCAATMEIAQLGIAGRNSNFPDFISSAAGAWVGIAIGLCLRTISLRGMAHARLGRRLK
jgi:VanZ family protein